METLKFIHEPPGDTQLRTVGLKQGTQTEFAVWFCLVHILINTFRSGMEVFIKSGFNVTNGLLTSPYKTVLPLSNRSKTYGDCLKMIIRKNVSERTANVMRLRIPHKHY